MASGSRLLDSSIVVALVRQDAALRARVAQCSDLYLTATSIGEMLYGVLRSGRPVENGQRVRRFAAGCTILLTDLSTAEEYARIRAALAAQGTPLPENDIWIAASAVQHGLTLATRDTHFGRIPGLAVEPW